MKIEYLREKDIKEVCALLRQCFPNSQIKDDFDFQMIDKKYDIVLVAKIEDRVVGHIWIQKQFDFYRQVDYFYLMYICVDPKYRRHGVATAMLTEVETWMEKEQVDYILFTSNRERKEALSLYRKLNYVEKGSFVFQKNRCKEV